METFNYEPGNMTGYKLVFGRDPSDDDYCILIWFFQGGSGGSAFRFNRFGLVHHSYLREKMAGTRGPEKGTGYTMGIADAAALLGFLAENGCEVGMPEGFNGRGLRSHESEPQPDNVISMTR